MSDSQNRVHVEAGDHAATRPEDQGAKVNWIPTGIMLAVVFWALIFGYYLSVIFPDQADVIRATQYVLLAAAALVAAPALARQFAPKVPRGARVIAVLPILIVLAIPLFIGLFWSSYDALNPVRIRSEGRLPDVGSLIRRNEHDVQRILGAYTVLARANLPESSVSDPSRPGGPDAERIVVYSLPDLNTMEWRPDRQALRREDAKANHAPLGTVGSPAPWNSDALVYVYYGAGSNVVGVRTDISYREAQRALSDVSSETVLSGLGISSVAPIVSPQQPDVLTNGAPVADTFWGSGTANGVPVGYQLQIGGISDFLADRRVIPLKVRADQGDITLVAAPNLTDATHMLVASATEPPQDGIQQAAGSSAGGAEATQHGKQSFSNRTFWIIVCSKPLKTEAAADEQAKSLNAQHGTDKPPCFSVERSGHLSGLGDSDFWIVLYDVGFEDQETAKSAARNNPWGFPLSGTWVVNITKQCGDFTISKIVQ